LPTRKGVSRQIEEDSSGFITLLERKENESFKIKPCEKVKEVVFQNAS
jgi:hypothetical protein